MAEGVAAGTGDSSDTPSSVSAASASAAPDHHQHLPSASHTIGFSLRQRQGVFTQPTPKNTWKVFFPVISGSKTQPEILAKSSSRAKPRN
jgi:hypothetical protein